MWLVACAPGGMFLPFTKMRKTKRGPSWENIREGRPAALEDHGAGSQDTSAPLPALLLALHGPLSSWT